MSGKNSSEEKTEPPSAKKLRDSRKKGQIARSREMGAAVVTVAAFGYLSARIGTVFDGLRDMAIAAGDAGEVPFSESIGPLANRLGHELAWTVGPFVALLAVSAILTNLMVNGGMLAAVDPVLPNLERLDPVEGFKRLFALRNMIELIKAILKVVAIGTIASLLIATSLQALVEQPVCGLGCVPSTLRRLLQPLLITVSGFFLVIGALDIGLQHWLFQRDMRMTKSEQKRERKEMEGDPLIKRQHRREQQAGLQIAVRTGLRNATFLVHSNDLALALRFAKPDAMVPVLVARGVAEGSSLLLDEARAAQLPVVFDASTARTLSRLKVGQMVHKEHFQMVIACMRQAGVM